MHVDQIMGRIDSTKLHVVIRSSSLFHFGHTVSALLWSVTLPMHNFQTSRSIQFLVLEMVQIVSTLEPEVHLQMTLFRKIEDPLGCHQAAVTINSTYAITLSLSKSVNRFIARAMEKTTEGEEASNKFSVRSDITDVFVEVLSGACMTD